MSEGTKILRMPDLVLRTGLSRTTIYRKIKEGTFPAQLRISDHCCGWRESSLERWMENPGSYRQEMEPFPCPRKPPGPTPKRTPPRKS